MITFTTIGYSLQFGPIPSPEKQDSRKLGTLANPAFREDCRARLVSPSYDAQFRHGVSVDQGFGMRRVSCGILGELPDCTDSTLHSRL